MIKQTDITGAGLGLRREMLDGFVQHVPEAVDFMEVAPENWMNLGGKFGKGFKQLTDANPFVCHGLSLSVGGPDELDEKFVRDVKVFLEEHNVKYYSEHLSYCSGNGHMYDLMPIPFTKEALNYVVSRVQRVQDILHRQLVLENVSYYAAPGQQMTELEFMLEVFERSDCLMLLDVNNIYVNSVNHGYDAIDFLREMPTNRIVYGHIAGHFNEAENLIVDTHGADVIENVWELLEVAYKLHGVFPTLLERDFNIPETSELIKEVERIKQIQQASIVKQAKLA